MSNIRTKTKMFTTTLFVVCTTTTKHNLTIFHGQLIPIYLHNILIYNFVILFYIDFSCCQKSM